MKNKIKVTYNVKRQREIQGLTLDQLSMLSGIGKSTISELENNKSHPTILTLLSIANALDVDITDLFTSN